MPRKTLFDTICESLKIKLKEGETFDAFAVRASDKVNRLKDPEWKELPEAVQVYANDTLKAREEKTELPELPGFPAAEEVPEVEPEETEETANDNPDAEPGEVTEPPEDAEQPETAPDTEEGAEESVDDGANLEEEVASTGGEDQPVARRRAAPASGKTAKPSAKPQPGKGKAVAKAAVKKAAVPKRAAAAPADASRINDEHKIKIIAKENPHRAGSKLHGYFKKYKEGMTVAAAKKAGIPPKNIAYLLELGHIKVAA